ncbi:thioredoxin family protein [Saccharopolyspora cebuensis]|uniref:Thioredoxin family protein n=1 Tax=Saccharopolyspora cebuensis TaxID=418759 RepID=A0ABV4CQK8_9PSEU
MTKRHVEVFTTGCPSCEPTVNLVQEMAGPGCEVIVHDLRSDSEAAAKASEYGVTRIPAVVVDGQLAECCQGSHSPTREGLSAAGVGNCG